jgi:uncharacterized protein (DUF924 family)
VTATQSEIIEFWLEEIGPQRWYDDSQELDNTIRERFMETWEEALGGKLESWECSREGALALLIVLDQFPRNMFRGEGRSFASDQKALAVAKKAISKGFDKQTPLPERIFFYMPMMHSENSVDQEHSVRLIKMNIGETAYLKHARVHREVIRKFGRFPYRNEALGRHSSEDEASYLANGGYASSVRVFAG